MTPDAKAIEAQLVNALADRLEAALEIVASSQLTSRLPEVADLCEATAALARAGLVTLER